MLRIYNTATRKKEILQSIEQGKIGIYVCGITVYDHCHIGHARAFIVFDMIVRYLRYRGFLVKHVRNITDIDDKIIKLAIEEGVDTPIIASRYIKSMHEDMAKLQIIKPNYEPKATEYIPQMIQLIERLIDKGYAYVASTGDVYYQVRKFKNYSMYLSHRDLVQLRTKQKIDTQIAKQDPLDFALWKKAKQGEPSWPSPWGAGRPGWHLECSTMSMDILGETFDIHGGGFDLIFPHHENECAQSEAFSGKKFANYWMHVGFLQFKKEKMSKSLDNFFTIRDILKKYHPETLRYFILSSHYRKPLEYHEARLKDSRQALARLFNAVQHVLSSDMPIEKSEIGNHYIQKFNQAMDDDFNTAAAMTVLLEMAKQVNKLKKLDVNKSQKLALELYKLGNILGLFQCKSEEFFKFGILKISEEKIKNLIQQRKEARQNKNWKKADDIRNQLEFQGIKIQDQYGQTQWRRL